MNSFQYTTLDRILAKITRDLGDIDIPEDDLIEWAGEALEFLNVAEVQSERVKILKVENYQADIPKGFNAVLQLARANNNICLEDLEEEAKNKCAKKEFNLTCGEDSDNCLDIEDNCGNEIEDCGCEEPIENLQVTPLKEDCGCGNCSDCCTDHEPVVLYFDMQMQYIEWVYMDSYKENFTPIRLSNKTFFKNLVCEEKCVNYDNVPDEYTIVGDINKKFRFSFKEGVVALSYLGATIDEETGYPLVPDQISFVTAIGYYIRWKIAQRYQWSKREGYTGLAQDSERLWLKYVKQAKNYATMPKTLDEYQNLMEQSHNMIPDTTSYYGFFGNLGRVNKQ